MRAIYTKDDYTGFTYNGIHSSQFGLFSVSNGDRYQRDLSPTFSDLTQQVPGQDGTHYFGTQMTQRVIALSIAFDDVTEQEFHEMKQWLNCGIKPLILDEVPYIQYYAKIQNTPQVKFVPFEDEPYERIYKGEATFNFICYDPYGYSVSKWIEDYGVASSFNAVPVERYTTNVLEWFSSSGLQKSKVTDRHTFDTFLSDEEGDRIILYNAGDLPAEYVLSFGITATPNDKQELTITMEHNSNTIGMFKINFDTAFRLFKINSTEERKILFTLDTKKRLLTAFTEVTENGVTSVKSVVANNALRGDFEKIPVSDDLYDVIDMNFSLASTSATTTNTATLFDVEIDYKYKYY